MFVEKLPVPQPNEETNKMIDEMLQAKEYDKIDNYVFELYNLTHEEIEFINSL